MWFEVCPFGHPLEQSSQFAPEDRVRKGQLHAQKRNALIRKMNLEFRVIKGAHGKWEMSLQGTPEQLVTAIRNCMDLTNAAALVQDVVVDSVHGSPLKAINGLLADMRQFLEADLASVLAVGIMQGPSPMKIIDRSEQTTGFTMPSGLQ